MHEVGGKSRALLALVDLGALYVILQDDSLQRGLDMKPRLQRHKHIFEDRENRVVISLPERGRKHLQLVQGVSKL